MQEGVGEVGKVSPEHQPQMGKGEGVPPQADAAEGRPVEPTRWRPGHARRLDGSSPEKKKDPSPRAQSCRRPGSRLTAPNFRASSRRPQPTTRSRPPPDPWTPLTLSSSPSAPRAGAVTPNEAAAPGTKSRSPPRGRLVPAPP